MPTFVHLVTLTAAGRRSFADGPVPPPAETARRFGGELLADHLTPGRHDVVSVTSFPDHASAARFTLAMAGGGQTRSETLRAFEPEAVPTILDGLDAGGA